MRYNYFNVKVYFHEFDNTFSTELKHRKENIKRY